MNKKIVWTITGILLASMLFLAGCSLDVNDPVRIIPIIEPYISVQPKSASYNSQAASYASTGYAELSVEVYEWQNADGVISYQWYTFESIEEYCEEPVGGEPIEDATESTYMPEITDVTPGKRYFYYVVITNYYLDAIADDTASIQSDLAIISFYGNNQPQPPVITKHPADAAYVIGRTASVTPMEVRAEIVGDGTLTYQWYTNTEFSITDGTPIDKADRASFMPDISTLTLGDHYFYVTVCNTSSRGIKAFVTCLPVKVTMKPGEKADMPRITLQPKDHMVFSGVDSAPELSVFAVPTDGGEITYEWHSMDKPASTTTVDRVPIPPVQTSTTPLSTNENFTPPITATGYYRVTVTNTNEIVTGDTTAVAYSKIVTVKVTTAVGTPPTTNATVTISNPNVPANRQQYIRGYGGMDVAWLNFPGQYAENTEMMYNPDWGLGFNILRIMIMPPGSNDGNYVGHEAILNKLLASGSLADNNRKADYIENVRIVNKYGGYVLASPWSPPKEWKSNNSVNSGGHLIPSYYKNFATYLRSFCQYMYYQGAPVYAVSIANEPNYAGGYDGCEWTADQMRDFWLEVGQFTEGVRGSGGGKSIPRVLTMNGESANTPLINSATLANDISRRAVDLYARHVYGDQTKTLWSEVPAFASWREGDPFQTECWMTEHNINSATASTYKNDYTWPYIWRFMNDVDLVIRLNNENAFVWWANVRFYSFIGDGVEGNSRNSVLPRGYGLSHFAKYTIDTTRLNVNVTGKLADGTDILFNQATNKSQFSNVNSRTFSLNSQDAKITAYVSQDGTEISMVMFTPTLVDPAGGVDMGEVKIVMPDGFTIGSVQAVKSTSANANDLFQPYDVKVSSGRNEAYVTLGNAEILSIKFTKGEIEE